MHCLSCCNQEHHATVAASTKKPRDLSVSTANYIAYSLDSYLKLMVGPQVDTIDKTQISSHLSFQDSDIFPASDKMLMVRIRKESCR